MLIEVTQCKECIYYVSEHCAMWNRPTKETGYCHLAETEVPEDVSTKMP